VPEADARPDTVAFVQEHLDRMERGDIVRGISDYAEDAVLEAAEVGEAGSLLTGTFQGREAIGRWIDGWFSSFDRGSYRFDVEESIENGDRVFMTLSHTARGAASSVEVANRIHHAFTVREGLIVRHAFSTEREPILRAAGIGSGE
jgi:ketosteroid isomerase-like protein